MEKLNMKTKLSMKFMHQRTFLIDLPAKLTYRILDHLDASSLKRCRLLNTIFLNLINNCEKYNKHWILDVSGWPVTADQEFVEVFMNSGLNFERFIGHTNKFTFIPNFFQKLGKTVKYINNLPFEKLDRETTELMIKTFNNVEDLKLNDNRLLCNMRRWELVWPSVKRLTMVGSLNVKKYEGDYSEFPNVEEITISFRDLMPKPAIYLIKTCPRKITGIKDKRLVSFPGENILKNVYKLPDLSLKRLKSRHDDVKKSFLKRQTEIVSYHITITLSYYLRKPLPDSIDHTKMHSLDVIFKKESKFDMKWLENMPNLKKFGIKLRRDFHCECSTCGKESCFLTTHDVSPNKSISALYINTNTVWEACMKCVRTLLGSFPHLQKLDIESLDFDFCHFWKMINQVLKKTGVSKNLTKFLMKADHQSVKINCEDYKYFKVMAHFPNLKELELGICHSGVSQKVLKQFCDKCPNLKKLTFGIGIGFNFELSGFLIHKMKYLKTLKFTDCRPEEEMDGETEEEMEIFAKPDVIQNLLMVPLKLWNLELPIRCERAETFVLFEKFSSLKSMVVLEMQGEDAILHSVTRTDYFDDLQKKKVEQTEN